MANEEEIRKHIIQVLEKIRPFINRDGGDVEFVDFKDGEVFIRFFGACVGCGLIDTTLDDGIAALLMEEVPEVIKVTNVTENI